MARKAHKETQALREAEQREKSLAEQALSIAKQRIKQLSSRIGERSSTQTVHREDSKGSSTGRNLKKRRTSECLQSAAEDVQQRRVETCKQ